MASRNWHAKLNHLHPELTLLLWKITIGATGAPTISVAPGLASIVRDSAGRYTLTLDQKFNGLIDYKIGFMYPTAGMEIEKGQLISEAVASTKAVVVGHYARKTSTPTITSTLDAAPVITSTLASVLPRVLDPGSGDVSDPTSASTQGTGAGGVTVWRVNYAAYRAQLYEGSTKRRKNGAAATDLVIHDTTNLLPAVNDDCVAAIVAEVTSGTWSVTSVKGAVATGGGGTGPSDATIEAAIGHAAWIKLGETTLTRSGDTTVSQAHDNEAGKELAKIDAPTITSTSDIPTITSTSSDPAETETATDPESGSTMFVQLWLRNSSVVGK